MTPGQGVDLPARQVRRVLRNTGRGFEPLPASQGAARLPEGFRLAHTIMTPPRAGRYRLAFLGKDDRVLAERSYDVRDRVPVAAAHLDALGRPRAGVATGRAGRVVIENRSPYYVQVHTTRAPGWDRLVPTAVGPGPGALFLNVRFQGSTGTQERSVLAPRDLEPYGTVELQLADTAVGEVEAGRVEITPILPGKNLSADATPALVVRPAD
jgi:hypothetical protein